MEQPYHQPQSLLLITILIMTTCALINCIYRYLSAINLVLKPNNIIELELKLQIKKKVSHDSYIFSFRLPNTLPQISIPIGQHIIINQQIRTIDCPDGELIRRSYTPINNTTQTAQLDLLIKIYNDTNNMASCSHYQAGKMSSWIDQLSIGDTINIQAPFGKMVYLGSGKIQFLANKQSNKLVKYYQKISMVAGGTGITAMFQLIQAIAHDQNDHTDISLLYANRSVHNIMIEDELEKYVDSAGLKLKYCLDQGHEGWHGYTGYINQSMLAESCFEPQNDTLVCICGPPVMCTLVTGYLTKIGHQPSNIFKF